MSRDPSYDILFEPIKIDPVTAKNRFYHALIAPVWDASYLMWRRCVATQGRGGRGVVCCEQHSTHPTSDSTPNAEVRLWDDSKVRRMAPIAASVPAH